MNFAAQNLCHGIFAFALFLLSLGCSSMSNDFSRGKAGWMERPTGAPKLLSPTLGKNDETFVRRTAAWRERALGYPKLISPRTTQSLDTVPVRIDEDNPKPEGSLPGSSVVPVRLASSNKLSELQFAWSSLSAEELAEQLEKGLYKEEVKAILNSASVVEVVNPWGKVWVMGSDTPPVFFDVRGRLIDWGWFDYHNLVADLDPTGDSLASPIRIVKQPTLDDIMPSPQIDRSF